MAIEKKLRRDAASIFKASLQAADPIQAVERALQLKNDTLIAGARRYPLKTIDHIYVLGAGKASAVMAKAVERLLGSRITGGWINTKDGHTAKLRRIHVHEASHPVPDERGVAGSREIAKIAEQAGPRDLVLCLISGGGSALLPLPADPITLAQKQETTKLLLACGATINEINALRKHISLIKGGQMARWAAPASVLALLLSDVIGDPLDVIGSGPTAPDPSSFQSAWAVIEKYQLEDKIPAPVRDRLQDGVSGTIAETPKAGDPCFEKTQNLVIGSNRLAVEAAARKAKELGYKPVVLSTRIDGETKEIARMHAAIALEVRESGNPAKAPVCLISGGETTVTLQGKGLGGRNQEFALAAAFVLDGQPDIVAFSAGTDGTDGPTDAAGALADGKTLQRAAAQGLNAQQFLANNDSYHFFESLGDLVKTGPTGTNVMDVRLMLIG